MLRNILIIFIVGSILVFAGSLQAHTFYMEDGRVLEGVIVAQDRDTMLIDPGDGKRQLIQKQELLRIVYRSAAPKKKAKPGLTLHPLLQSALVPGWGDRSIKRTKRGWVYTGSGLFLVTLLTGLYQESSQLRAAYRSRVINTSILTLSLSGNIAVSSSPELAVVYLLGAELNNFLTQAAYRRLRNSERTFNNAGGLTALFYLGQWLGLRHEIVRRKNKKVGLTIGLAATESGLSGLRMGWVIRY